MIFRIADTFTNSLASLSGEEQKMVKTVAFDLQMNPAHPGHRLHRIERVKDKNFWSVRVNRGLRIIVHNAEGSLMLCYVNHHDKAYQWAEKRKIQIHPRTGAAQLVEIRESVQKIIIPQYVTEKSVSRPLADKSRDELFNYGVPDEWIEDLLHADEDELLKIAERLPCEAAEAILSAATGVEPDIRRAPASLRDSFQHPDSLRRFRVMEDRDELERALNAPWEQWSVFLHPAQRAIVEGQYSGPVRVSGSAGTGKTIVAIHRAVYLAMQNPESRILLTTFSSSLAEVLESKLRILLHKQPRLGVQIEVHALDAYILTLHKRLFGEVHIINSTECYKILDQIINNHPGVSLSKTFLRSEWSDVVDQRQISSWDEYKNALRLGRRKRLSEEQRQHIWTIFDAVIHRLDDENKFTLARIYRKLEEYYGTSGRVPFNYIIIDEAQDISIPALRFLSSISKPNQQTLFFTGDLGQRIFQQPFSWATLGIDIRGRAHILKMNYRTSHQIRSSADKLLDMVIKDVDGNVEERRGTISVFNGLAPTIRLEENRSDEKNVIARWIAKRIDEGISPAGIGIIVRSEKETTRAQEVLETANIPARFLQPQIIQKSTVNEGAITIATMHLAKGLEFRAVVVMACDDDVIPSSARLGKVGDDSALEEVYITEKHLLYVACTRARDHLLITGIKPGSEFLEDMKQV